jgi:pimeloyl-ACP methyl ester carboxylesterase
VKEPLLLIHGFTDTARTWSNVIPLLEPQHEVLAPTSLGHHGGPPVPSGMKDPMAAIADGLEAVLDEAGHEKAHIAGNSLGGWLAFELAARGRALSVVGISPAMGWESDQPPAHTRMQFKLAHTVGPRMAPRGKSLVTRPGIRKLMFRDLVAHPERISPAIAYDLLYGSAECTVFDAYMEHVANGDYRGKWPDDLGVPVRIAWGTRDRTIPFKTCSGWYRSALPDAEWVELPDCGHLAQHDDPELVARTILEVTDRATVSA